jgi:hypothetical protein
MIALEGLSERIAAHFERFKLVAVVRRENRDALIPVFIHNSMTPLSTT